MALILIFGAPAVFLAAAASLYLQNRRRGLGWAFLFAAAAILAGGWAIVQSRASTAGIGFIFLPTYGAAAGALAWAFANALASGSRALRAAGWVALAGALAVPGSLAVSGLKTIEKNRIRDAEHKAHRDEIDRHRASLRSMMAGGGERKAAELNSMIEGRTRDRAFLIAALERPEAAPELLDRLAGSEDYGIALQAVRHPSCPPSTLERVYRTHSYPDFFFQALAAHPNAPGEILREIFRRPRSIGGLDLWFAQNPATPPDILEEIARRTRDASVIQSFFKNEKLGCALLPILAASLAASSRPDDQYSNGELERRRSACLK